MNFGAVERQGHYWVVTCEPHVRARLKRVFPRVPQSAGDSLAVLDTPETSRELLWFLQRYPMDVSGRDHLEAQASRHVDMEQRLADLLTERTSPPYYEMAVTPRDYQAVAGSAIEIRGGLLLADDVGLGKTVSGICPMTQPGRFPAVVVYPAFLPDHWPEQLRKCMPQLRVHHIRKSQPYPLTKQPRQRMADLWDTLPDVILVSYHKLRGWADVLGEIVQYAIFEEVQQLRHNSSEIYRAAKHLANKAQLRAGLSATPIYNYGSEFFWVVDALLPGALGTHDEFVREWCESSGDGKHRLRDTNAFGAYLRREGIMLRRTRAEVGRELPPLTKVVHTVASDTSVIDKISTDAIDLARIIVAHNERYKGQKMQASGEFDALMRQATGVAKAPYVAEFVKLLVESGERVLLFGWHRAVYDIWMERLKELNPVLYTGTESPAQKRAAKEAFLAGDSQVMIMSLRSGAGLDGLQDMCSIIVFGELDWSPGVHEQCIGRPWRDGQLHPVTAYFLVTEDGADPIMSDVLGIKREQIEGVCNPGSPLAERIDLGENQLRLLARQFLEKQGIAVPEMSPAPIRVEEPA